MPEFVELQKQLSRAIDIEAAELAARRARRAPSCDAPDRHRSLHEPNRNEGALDMTATVNESTRNGVDTATLFATLDAVKAAPEAAKFQFRAHNEWISGTHSRGTIHGFFGVGEERTHERSFHFDADHPAVLVGRGQRPDPGGVPAARARRLPDRRPGQHRRRPRDPAHRGALRPCPVTSTSTASSGSTPTVRNGYQNIAVRFTVKGDAPAEKLRELVEQSRARSAVFDVITNQVPVTIEVTTD